MDGKVYDTALRHGQSLPFISPRQQDASDASVIPQSHRPSDIRTNRSDRNERIGVPNITGTLRQQALDELLTEHPRISRRQPRLPPVLAALRPPRHRRFRRDWLQPERAAFEAAVRQQQSRRAAA